VLLTDINYLSYGKRKRATYPQINQRNFSIPCFGSYDVATDIILHLRKNRKGKLADGALIHSDQGRSLYQPNLPKTSEEILLRALHVHMRKWLGSCASKILFWTFQDEVTLHTCETLDQVKQEIKQYYDLLQPLPLPGV
jgi:putative transposase